MNEDDDPFQFQFDHYDEDPGPSLFAGGQTHNKELTLKESTMKLQSPQLLIEKTLDVQMRTGSGLSSDVIAGDVLACTVGDEDVQSTPSRGRRRSVPSGGEDPTPKRRRLRGKSAPPRLLHPVATRRRAQRRQRLCVPSLIHRKEHPV